MPYFYGKSHQLLRCLDTFVVYIVACVQPTQICLARRSHLPPAPWLWEAFFLKFLEIVMCKAPPKFCSGSLLGSLEDPSFCLNRGFPLAENASQNSFIPGWHRQRGRCLPHSSVQLLILYTA